MLKTEKDGNGKKEQNPDGHSSWSACNKNGARKRCDVLRGQLMPAGNRQRGLDTLPPQVASVPVPVPAAVCDPHPAPQSEPPKYHRIWCLFFTVLSLRLLQNCFSRKSSLTFEKNYFTSWRYPYGRCYAYFVFPKVKYKIQGQKFFALPSSFPLIYCKQDDS